MHIAELFEQPEPAISFEFFPPRSPDAVEGLFAAIRELEPLKPSYVSVTYGAGGSTRALTHDLVVRIKTSTSLDPTPHLTCVCHQEHEIREILEGYAAHGISNVLALGGDAPRDMPDYNRAQDAFAHAADLVRFIRQFNDRGGHPDKRGFGIGVAGFPEGHPATPNRVLELEYLKAKVDAGADYICTQLFFDNRDFYDFRERCELIGIRVPIVAGIMPLTSAAMIRRLPELAGGARYPAPLLRQLKAAGSDDAAICEIGTQWATEQTRDLLENDVRGIHFYTLNKSTATRDILARISPQPRSL